MKKFITAIIAILLIVVASAYTLKKDATKRSSLYWYPVTYDSSHTLGQIDPDAEPVYAEKSAVLSDCTPGTARDCFRGYTAPIEVTYPTPASIDQIKRD